MQRFITFLFSVLTFTAFSQSSYQSLDTIKAPANYENVYVRALYMDSADVSSYVIFIRNEVKTHKHVSHAEHVMVLEGMGMMTLGDKKFKIKKGDIIFIPKETFHSVMSISKKSALKVLSIQAPFFDGKDRVFKD
ncbi:MAG: cupin domain-containing protein [Bacteroidota bacterium]|nr:cupin domain-containing protein [Bacteroidota bacterium]